MSDFDLDLSIRVFRRDQRIWAVFPGLSRRFFPIFQQQGVVFLESPAIALNKAALEDEKTLRQHVSMSLAWAKYHSGAVSSPPSRDPATFEIEYDRSFGAALGNVRALYKKVQRQDLILVGQYDIYSPILIGEVSADFDPKDVLTVEKYGNEKIPYRRVKWRSVDQERRYFSQSLSKLLSNRRAVIQIDTIQFGPEVFEAAFGDYVFDDISRYVFDGREYRNKATATVPGIDLISYFCAAFSAMETDKIDLFAALEMSDAIRQFFDEKLLESFEIVFSSPGEYVLLAKRGALPIFVALMVAATGGDHTFTEAKAALITNSAAPQVHTAAPANANMSVEEEAQKRYDRIMEAINYKRYEEWVKKNKEAQRGVGMKVKVKLRKKS